MFEITTTNHVTGKTEVVMVPNSEHEGRRFLHVIARILTHQETFDETLWIHSELVSFWSDGQCAFEIEIINKEESDD